MGVINRFLLLLLSLAAAVLSLAVIGAASGLLAETVWLDSLHYALSRRETIALAAAAFLISLKLLGCVFHRSHEKATGRGEYVIESSPQGEVRVALDAVKNLTERLAREAHGVRDARVRVKVQNNRDGASLALALNLTIGREAEVKKLTEHLTGSIQQHLAQTMALTDVPVSIVISDVSDAVPDRKHRVT